MRIKESMDTTDIKDTIETMAIPVLEYPVTVLGRPVLEYPGTVSRRLVLEYPGTVLGCLGPLETPAYINNATQQHIEHPENLNGYPTGLCLGHRLKELDNVVEKHCNVVKKLLQCC